MQETDNRNDNSNDEDIAADTIKEILFFCFAVTAHFVTCRITCDLDKLIQCETHLEPQYATLPSSKHSLRSMEGISSSS